MVDFFPWLRLIDPQHIRTRMGGHFKNVLKLICHVIDERIEHRAPQGSASEKGDILDTLINTFHGNQGAVTRKEIEHLIMVSCFIS